MNRASQRDASNGEVQTTHPCTPTCELQAKKHAADDKEWRSSISELEGCLATETHGLKLGRSWSRQTNIEESDPTHQRPSSTNHFHHPREVEPTQTCTYKSREKTGMHDGNPMWFHTSHQEGGFVQDLAKPRKISQYLSSQKTRLISNKDQWSSDQVQWTSMMNFHESITRGRRNESGTLWQ